MTASRQHWLLVLLSFAHQLLRKKSAVGVQEIMLAHFASYEAP
jgi:hypothetical protein